VKEKQKIEKKKRGLKRKRNKGTERTSKKSGGREEIYEKKMRNIGRYEIMNGGNIHGGIYDFESRP